MQNVLSRVGVFAALGGLLFPAALFAQAVGEAEVAARRAELERNLAAIEAEIAEQQTLLEAKQRERVSLERDVAILTAKIEQAKLSIRARDLVIQRIAGEIRDKERTIGGLDEKLLREKQSLAQLIRKTNEIDGFTLAEIILGNENLSTLFEDLDRFDSIKAALRDSFVEIADTKAMTEAARDLLEEKQAEELELRRLQELQKRKIEEQEAERRRILAATRGVEEAYQRLILSKEKTAGEIRAELFALRGTAAIPFGEALAHANAAAEKTGVRAAFLLGVIAEESNLGENVGQCILTNEPHKGDGKGINTGRYFRGVMKPDRDVDPFLRIAARLGINPYGQVVSCPPSYGYGGAMGPAQFIPSTWVLYEERIAKATGQVPPNPWDPRTAFMAAAILLADNGAARGTPAAERLAALRYFAGWQNASRPAYAFYGEEVMELAAKYQRQIDILAGA